MEAIRQRFVELVASGGDLPLDEAALLVATTVDPELDVAAQLQRLDDLAAESSGSTPIELAGELFGSGRFFGDQVDYYDPRNSMLSTVLDRGLGIPITLSVLFIEIARRRGMTVEGVGMPGHFLCKADDQFIDPFHRGRVLTPMECEQIYQSLAGRPVQLPAGSLDPTPGVKIVERMLWNLRSIAEGRGDTELGNNTLAMLSAFDDASAAVRMVWARAMADTGRFDLAAQAATEALKNAPEASQERIRQMAQEWSARLN